MAQVKMEIFHNEKTIIKHNIIKSNKINEWMTKWNLFRDFNVIYMAH